MVAFSTVLILLSVSSTDGTGVRASNIKLKKIQGIFLLLLNAFSFSLGKRFMDFPLSALEDKSFNASPNDSEIE